MFPLLSCAAAAVVLCERTHGGHGSVSRSVGVGGPTAGMCNSWLSESGRCWRMRALRAVRRRKRRRRKSVGGEDPVFPDPLSVRTWKECFFRGFSPVRQWSRSLGKAAAASHSSLTLLLSLSSCFHTARPIIPAKAPESWLGGLIFGYCGYRENRAINQRAKRSEAIGAVWPNHPRSPFSSWEMTSSLFTVTQQTLNFLIMLVWAAPFSFPPAKLQKCKSVLKFDAETQYFLYLK